MPYRRFLREQNIYVPDKANPALQTPPPPQQQQQGQLYQSPPPHQGQLFHSPPQGQLYQSPPLPPQLFHSPPGQIPIYQSPPQQQISAYQSPPGGVTYFQSPQQVEMVGNRPHSSSSSAGAGGVYNPHLVGQPLPPGMLGRLPRNGTIVQQHTHYPFAPLQPQQQQQQQIPVVQGGGGTVPQATGEARKRKSTAEHAGGESHVRPLFTHQPTSSSSLVSEDPAQAGEGEGKKGGAGKKGKKVASSSSCAGTGRAGKEKSKAKACIYCRRR